MPLVVTIQLDKHGLGELTDIATVRITNDGTGDETFGDYEYTYVDAARCWGGQLHDFDRRRGATALVREVLSRIGDTP